MKNIIVLGATGSIGDSVLSVIKQNKNKLNLLGISFSSNISKAKEGADKSPTKRQIENQKYVKIKLKPHKNGCLKLFLIHS